MKRYIHFSLSRILSFYIDTSYTLLLKLLVLENVTSIATVVINVDPHKFSYIQFLISAGEIFFKTYSYLSILSASSAFVSATWTLQMIQIKRSYREGRGEGVLTAHKRKLHGVPGSLLCTGASRALAKVRLVFYLEKCTGCNFIFYEHCARFSPHFKWSNSCVVAFPVAVESCRTLIKSIVTIARFFAIYLKNVTKCALSPLYSPGAIARISLRAYEGFTAHDEYVMREKKNAAL